MRQPVPCCSFHEPSFGDKIRLLSTLTILPFTIASLNTSHFFLSHEKGSKNVTTDDYLTPLSAGEREGGKRQCFFSGIPIRTMKVKHFLLMDHDFLFLLFCTTSCTFCVVLETVVFFPIFALFLLIKGPCVASFRHRRHK